MYKVFINDAPIIFTSSSEKNSDFPVFNADVIVVEELIHKLKVNDFPGVYLYSTTIAQAFADFLSHFKVITAGGGLVVNSKKEILFIHRNGVWDLPKGRIEDGESIEETAIREVEEECGIANLTINQFLLKTYHIFYWDNQPRIKETYWYLMNTNYKGQLIPQLEEGITEVCFKKEVEIPLLFENTYANIKSVYESYKAI